MLRRDGLDLLAGRETRDYVKVELIACCGSLRADQLDFSIFTTTEEEMLFEQTEVWWCKVPCFMELVYTSLMEDKYLLAHLSGKK